MRTRKSPPNVPVCLPNVSFRASLESDSFPVSVSGKLSSNPRDLRSASKNLRHSLSLRFQLPPQPLTLHSYHSAYCPHRIACVRIDLLSMSFLKSSIIASNGVSLSASRRSSSDTTLSSDLVDGVTKSHV